MPPTSSGAAFLSTPVFFLTWLLVRKIPSELQDNGRRFFSPSCDFVSSNTQRANLYLISSSTGLVSNLAIRRIKMKHPFSSQAISNTSQSKLTADSSRVPPKAGGIASERIIFLSKTLHSFQLQMMIQFLRTDTIESTSPDGVNVGTINLVSEVEAMSNKFVTRSRRPTSEQRNAAPSSNDKRAAEHRVIVEDRRASSGATRHRRIERLCNDSLSLLL